MNKFITSLMAIAIASFIFTGCVEDCTNDCNLRGEADPDNNCACDCDFGFEGTNCDALATGKFIGNWDALDECDSGQYPYDAIINTDVADQAKVKVFNFAGFGQDRSWEFDIAGDSIKIPLSAFEFTSDSMVFSGLFEGVGIMAIDGATIDWEYNLMYDGGAEEGCTGVWTKVQ